MCYLNNHCVITFRTTIYLERKVDIDIFLTNKVDIDMETKTTEREGKNIM